MVKKSYKQEYKSLFLSPEWQKFRLKIFERDNFSCRFCGSDTGTLHAHHTYYEDFGTPPWMYDEHTVITLCDGCHEQEHSLLKIVNKMTIDSINKSGISWAQKSSLITWFEIMPKELPVDYWSVMSFLFDGLKFYEQAKELYYHSNTPREISIKDKMIENLELIFNSQNNE